MWSLSKDRYLDVYILAQSGCSREERQDGCDRGAFNHTWAPGLTLMRHGLEWNTSSSIGSLTGLKAAARTGERLCMCVLNTYTQTYFGIIACVSLPVKASICVTRLRFRLGSVGDQCSTFRQLPYLTSGLY